MDQFSVGFVCGTGQMMHALRTVAVGSIRSAWEHRQACFRTAILAGPLGVAGTAAMIGSWFFKIKRLISPVAWMRAAGPVAHHSIEAVAHSLINVSERLSECQDD